MTFIYTNQSMNEDGNIVGNKHGNKDDNVKCSTILFTIF